MSYTLNGNTVSYLDPWNVGAVIGYYGGDYGECCTHEAIDMWCKYKPQSAEDTIGILSDNERAAGNWGLEPDTIKNIEDDDDRVEALQTASANPNCWTYNRPTSKFRITDFDKYHHACVCPFRYASFSAGITGEFDMQSERDSDGCICIETEDDFIEFGLTVGDIPLADTPSEQVTNSSLTFEDLSSIIKTKTGDEESQIGYSIIYRLQGAEIPSYVFPGDSALLYPFTGSDIAPYQTSIPMTLNASESGTVYEILPVIINTDLQGCSMPNGYFKLKVIKVPPPWTFDIDAEATYDGEFCIFQITYFLNSNDGTTYTVQITNLRIESKGNTYLTTDSDKFPLITTSSASNTSQKVTLESDQKEMPEEEFTITCNYTINEITQATWYKTFTL